MKVKGHWGPSITSVLILLQTFQIQNLPLLRADTVSVLSFQVAPENAGIFMASAATNASRRKRSMFTAQIINCAVWSPGTCQKTYHGKSKFLEAWSYQKADEATLSLTPVDSWTLSINISGWSLCLPVSLPSGSQKVLFQVVRLSQNHFIIFHKHSVEFSEIYTTYNNTIMLAVSERLSSNKSLLWNSEIFL